MNVFNAVRNWWNDVRDRWADNRNGFYQDLRLILRVFRRLGRMFGKMAFMGLILNVVATFCPEIQEKCPTIIFCFDGCLQVAEFILKRLVEWLIAICL